MQVTNKIILGTVQFGLNYGINNAAGKPDGLAINEMLCMAYNSGIRCLDTAEAYGTAHEVIGQFHRNHPYKVFNVITKLPHQINEHIEAKFERYLNQLNVTQLHGLLFHSYQSYKENKNAMAILNNYKYSGKVKYLGVSVYTNTQMEDVIDDADIDIIQLPFNLFDNITLRGDMIGKAKNKGKIIHVRSAFLQGLFFMSPQNESKVVRSLSGEVKYINELSAQWNIPLQKMALNYCLQQQNIDNVLIGVDNLDQLNQNLADANYSLPAKLIDEINLIAVKDVNLLNPSLWNQ